MIGRALWRARGALTLRREGGGFVMDSARSENFDRPWAPAVTPVVAPGVVTAATPSLAPDVPPDDATPREEDIEADQ